MSTFLVLVDVWVFGHLHSNPTINQSRRMIGTIRLSKRLEKIWRSIEEKYLRMQVNKREFLSQSPLSSLSSSLSPRSPPILHPLSRYRSFSSSHPPPFTLSPHSIRVFYLARHASPQSMSRAGYATLQVLRTYWVFAYKTRKIPRTFECGPSLFFHRRFGFAICCWYISSYHLISFFWYQEKRSTW